jgi:UDP-2,3-diacylglucosamine pyrophosphatase LpxH
LEKIYRDSKRISITKNDKIIIFSDLHLGNGRFNDSFTPNANLFQQILTENYLEKDYTLILNGDVEELYKFSINNIKKKWSSLYLIFDEFISKNKFFKIFGNHDYELKINHSLHLNYQLYESIILDYYSNELFVYHGHQTAPIIEQYSKIIIFFVKYLFRLVGNDSVPIDNNKKYLTEATAYKFSIEKKIISILGHTHRPLFESLSKIDSLKITIEHLINKYLKVDDVKKNKISQQIQKYKEEFEKVFDNKNNYLTINSLYNNRLMVPCLFNSGAVTGKRGITGIEINKGFISLVYWFDINRSKRYLNYKNVEYKRLKKTNFFKAVLKRDNLDYLFTRIKLLT